MSIRRPILPPVSALRTLESLDRLRTAAAIVNPKWLNSRFVCKSPLYSLLNGTRIRKMI